MNQDRKRQAKQKKRELEVRHKKLEVQAEAILRSKREKYPDIVIGRRDADPKFIDSVVEASKSFNFLDTKRLGGAQQAFYRMGKECGFEDAIDLLESLPSINYGERAIMRSGSHH